MRRLGSLCSTVALLVAVAACSGDPVTTADDDGDRTSTGTTSTPPPPPPPAAPEVGECRALDYSDISRYSNDTKPVKCSKDHTAYTYDVAELPSSVAIEGVEIQNDAVQAAAAKKCQTGFAGFIGGNTQTRALSRLTVTYFLPDQAGFDAGAHWVRCDVVAVEQPKVLAPLPKDVEGLLDDDKALRTYGVCSQGEPGGASADLVMCTQEHDYRAVAAIELGGDNADYPGEKVVRDDGQADCEELIADLLGVTGGFTYSWTYPSESEWAAGQRLGFCWNQATE
jgi:hypothetical protein